MAYVPVPKDLNAVKTKVMFNLTKRQLICFGSGAAVAVPLFFLCKSVMNTSAASIIMIVVLLPFMLLAMYEKNGQPLERLSGTSYRSASFARNRDRIKPTTSMRFWSDRKISTRRYTVLSEKQKLTRAEKRQIEAAIARAKNQDKKKKSAQDSIPFERMFPDGICRVNPGYFTKTIQFQDINYQLSQNEDKTAIFDGWCDFLNYLDSSVKFQLSFMNMAANKDTYGQSIAIPPQDDDFDNIREEYTQMLRSHACSSKSLGLTAGNNGLIKTKYLTFGIEAANMKEAKPRLDRIETDLLNNFKRLGVAAEPLNGKQRLALMHGMFHMGEHIDFHFEWEWLAPSGLSVKDFIAPSSFEFRNGKEFGIGKKLGAVSFLQILAPELNDRMLADFLDMESSLIVTMHIQSVDQTKAIKTVKRKITDLQKMTIEEQKKAVRSGYDMDIIPSDLATYAGEAKKILQDLQSEPIKHFL